MVHIMRPNTITRIIIGVLMIFAVSNAGAAKSGCLPLEKIIETTGGGQNNEIELWAERCSDAQSWVLSLSYLLYVHVQTPDQLRTLQCWARTKKKLWLLLHLSAALEVNIV